VMTSRLIRLILNDILTKGDKVMIRWTNSGTNAGPLFGNPPTGNACTLQNIVFCSVKDMASSWKDYPEATNVIYDSNSVSSALLLYFYLNQELQIPNQEIASTLTCQEINSLIPKTFSRWTYILLGNIS